MSLEYKLLSSFIDYLAESEIYFKNKSLTL